MEMTATVDLVSLAGPWKQYSNDGLNLIFDYPVRFDNTSDCRVRAIRMKGFDELSFFGYDTWTEIRIGGERFIVGVVEIGNIALSNAVDQFAPSGVEISRLDVQVANVDAVQLEYSDTDLVTYQVVTYFKKNSFLYIYVKGNSEACKMDIDEKSNRKMHVLEYFRILESIHFSE